MQWILLAVKSQDTRDALEQLASVIPSTASIVCLQNGVENERAALRLHPHVYGGLVIMPNTFVEPGVVQVHASPKAGVVDIGRIPSGEDDRSRALAAAFGATGSISSRSTSRIRPWKYTKLLRNLGNAAQAICGPEAGTVEIVRIAVAEAERCYRAAGIEWVPLAEYRGRYREAVRIPESSRAARVGSSTWQSMARKTGSTEVPYLNGEILLLGRLHGISTPANTVLQDVAQELALRCMAPGPLTEPQLELLLESRYPMAR